MSNTANTGWIKNKNGEKFAPKTLGSQVIIGEDDTLENILNELKKVLLTVQLVTWEADD